MADKTAEWGDQVWLLKVDLVGTFGSMRHTDLSQTLVKRIVQATALAVMQLITCHPFVPHWMETAREEVQTYKYRRQGAPEGPLSWSILLDEVMAHTLSSWQHSKYRVICRTLFLRVRGFSQVAKGHRGLSYLPSVCGRFASHRQERAGDFLHAPPLGGRFFGKSLPPPGESSFSVGAASPGSPERLKDASCK